MKFNLTSPVRKSVLANFYGIGVNLLNQIVLVPFFISFWGINLYSDWIVLTAVSSFFSMSDIGLNTVTSNRFSIAYNNDNMKECASLITNNIVLIISILSLFICLGVPFFFCSNLKAILDLRTISSSIAGLILFALVIKIFTGMLSSIYVSFYRAKSLAHRAFFIGNTVRLTETLLLFLGIILHFSMSTIVFFYCIPTLVQLIYYKFDSRKYYDYQFNFRNMDKSLFFKVLTPSFSFMSFPVGYAIILQGFTLLVNRYFGAESVVLYNTTRTMSNFIKVLPNAIKNAIWPEFTIAYGKKDYFRMRVLHRKAVLYSFTVVLLIAVFLSIFGGSVYEIWTHRAVQFDRSLMIAYMAVVLVNSVWEVSGMTLMATNMHTRLGFLFVCLSAFSLGMGFFLVHYVHSLVMLVFCVLGVDICLSLYTIRKSMKITRDSWKNIFHGKSCD